MSMATVTDSSQPKREEMLSHWFAQPPSGTAVVSGRWRALVRPTRIRIRHRQQKYSALVEALRTRAERL